MVTSNFGSRSPYTLRFPRAAGEPSSCYRTAGSHLCLSSRWSLRVYGLLVCNFFRKRILSKNSRCYLISFQSSYKKLKRAHLTMGLYDVILHNKPLTSSGKYTETSAGAEASVRQRSALAQVGSPAAREKRSVFPRAVAEVSRFHYSYQSSITNRSYFAFYINSDEQSLQK